MEGVVWHFGLRKPGVTGAVLAKDEGNPRDFGWDLDMMDGTIPGAKHVLYGIYGI